MKVSELEGVLLDYWVAKAEGWVTDPYRPARDFQMRKPFRLLDLGFTGISDGGCDRLCIAGGGKGVAKGAVFSPSIDGAQGVQIIEREKIGGNYFGEGVWTACHSRGPRSRGPTFLIAAMRAFVKSKYGDEVPTSFPP